MWSRFEKLKDNITQIASDVLDSQDEDLDGEAGLDEKNNGRLRDSDGEDDDSPEGFPDELGYYKEKGDQRQSDVDAAMMKYAGLLEEKETEVSILREENRLLKEQFLINSTKLDALLNDRNNKEKTNGHVEQLDGDEALVEKAVIEPENVLEDYNNRFSTPETAKLELSSLNGKAAYGSEETVPVFSEAEGNESDYTVKESHEAYSDKESQASRAEDEQVRSLSERLRVSEDVCCSLQTKLEAVSLERDSLSKSLEEVSLEPARLAKELEEVLLERDTVSKKVEEVLLERDALSKKMEEVLLERDALSKRLEEALQEPNILSKKIEEVQQEPDTLSKKMEEVLQERDSLLKKVEEVSIARDKAVQNLGRLRQNLLDMESSTSEKMDNDSILIGDLELRLKTAEDLVGQLQQALAKSQDDLAQANRNNDSKSRDTNDEIQLLKQRLQACSEALESKDMELANLQSALGQYYAESDAQERLESELRAVREMNARLSRDLKIAEGTIDLKSKELETVTKKLGSADALNEEQRLTMHKLQQDVLKLRAALEQSITSLNRMSSDSDFYVDRRIVIKLLVTYFQRHHSREVLDLMVRMLGFSEEDKRRVGMAQQNARGGGMVRSVFGVPGRIVGGILGSSDPDTSPRAAPGDNQSFADMWIDFLLKETQERERRERGEAPPLSPMANTTRSMPSSPSGFSHKPSSSFSGFPSSFLLPPKPTRVSSSTDLETILTGESRETRDDATSS
ncbi:hypothetical protein M758_1G110700 [Ceratodon purpureus]|nr:hypothetical protein M758_1G110700 [Ceratodon purpureus]